jgi:glycolate oxidase iron-sulfur subunit
MSDAFAGLAPCVHCGFCLQSCPTFLVTSDESDSPRGRILLMRRLEQGDAAPSDPALQLHLDRCLGCRACEPVCPSGVSYGPALEAVRHILARARPVPLAARVVTGVLGQATLRGPLLALARAARPLARYFAGGSRLGFMAGMLAATRTDGRDRRRVGAWSRGVRRAPEAPADTAPRRNGESERGHGVVGVESAGTHGAGGLPGFALFTGCIMDGLFSHVHRATERTLVANGYRPVSVPDQGCCGALHAHVGLHEDAVALARANVRAFAQYPDAAIVVNAAGCGAMLRDYGRLLADDPLAAEAAAFARRVVDVTEPLAAAGPRAGAALDLTVAYDPPCHLLHAQRVAEAPLRVLDAIPRLKRVSHAEAAVCCGSAGSYSLTEAAMSRAVLARKVQALVDAEPDVVASGNPGCVMQIGAGLRAAGRRTPVVHPVELLDHSYALAGYYSPV